MANFDVLGAGWATKIASKSVKSNAIASSGGSSKAINTNSWIGKQKSKKKKNLGCPKDRELIRKLRERIRQSRKRPLNGANLEFSGQAIMNGTDYGEVLGASWGKKLWRGSTRVVKTVARQTVNTVKDTGANLQRTASIVKNVATGDFSKAGRQTTRLGKAMTVNLAKNTVKSGAHLVMESGRSVRDIAQGIGGLAMAGKNVVQRVLRRAFRKIIRTALGKKGPLNGEYTINGQYDVLGADDTPPETPQMEQGIVNTGLQALQAAGKASPSNKRGIIKAVCMGAATALVALMGQAWMVPLAPLVMGGAFDLAWSDEVGTANTAPQEIAQSQGDTSVPSYDNTSTGVPNPYDNSSAGNAGIPSSAGNSSMGFMPSQESSSSQSGSNTPMLLAAGAAAVAAMLLI